MTYIALMSSIGAVSGEDTLNQLSGDAHFQVTSNPKAMCLNRVPPIILQQPCTGTEIPSIITGIEKKLKIASDILHSVTSQEFH
jgi:hypothetical protein